MAGAQAAAMSSTWPLEAMPEGDSPLPPPWDQVVDLEEQKTELDLLRLQYEQPMLALSVCRKAFVRADALGQKQAALRALYLACVVLFNSGRHAQGDRVFAIVRERAVGMEACELFIRIELTHSKRLSAQRKHAQAMVLRQKILGAAMALGNTRLICLALCELASSAYEAGDAELVLSLLEQLEQWRREDDVVLSRDKCYRTGAMALACYQIAQAREAVADHAAARAGLRQAHKLALSACAFAKTDREKTYSLETLVQLLLKLGDCDGARAEVERCAARLAAVPDVGSQTWSSLELARARIDFHGGGCSEALLDTLQVLEASTVQESGAEQSQARQLLLLALERAGRFEQALACHKRACKWHDVTRSARSRQRLKMLRHTVLSMRAEALEFITHDLLTPLAAAQTWSQALLREHLPPALPSPLRDAHRLLAHARALSDQYLGLLRAELMPRTRLQVLDFGALADDVCENVAPRASSDVRLTRAIDIGAPVMGDATLLTRALAALLADALNRAPAGTRVELRFAHDTVKGEAVLSISHQGAGPGPSARTQLYQQAFDGKLFGDHLGLALAAKICRLHRMRLRFETVPGQGSALRLTMKTEACAWVTAAGESIAKPGACVPEKAP
jgi:signal transduction histidine kinase